MAWQHIVQPYDTSDMSATIPTIFQRIKVSAGEPNYLLHGIQAGIVHVGDPSFTSIKAELWSDDGDGPSKLIAQSTTTWTKAQILTLPHGYKTVGFAFNKIGLRNGLYYCIALRAAGYTGSDNSYLSWRKSWPDPQYPTGVTQEVVKGLFHPYDLILIGSEK